MNVYIDVTNFMYAEYISGMQRVVRQVIFGLLEKQELTIRLIQYENDRYHILDNNDFLGCFKEGRIRRGTIKKTSSFKINAFEPEAVLLEMDSVWNNPCRRLVLYPELKARGVKIVVYFQDIIPLMWPQYCQTETKIHFIGFMTAAMQYADMFLSSTQTNLEYLNDYLKSVGVSREVPMKVTWLGMDFRPAEARQEHPVPSEEKLLLMVGTIEPRKNHTLVLDAMDTKLYELGYKLVIAGRLGWNVTDIQRRIKTHPQYGKQLIWLEQTTDQELESLYRQAEFVVFPSKTEGFGLPIVEAFIHGTPVLCANHPVMREVGGDYCVYFDPSKPQELVNLVETYQGDAYERLQERIKQYPFVTWKEVVNKVVEGIVQISSPKRRLDFDTQQMIPKQMVVLTARIEDLLQSIPFWETFMPFLQELVLCCPDMMKEEMEQKYHGRLKIKFITDSMATAGQSLPQDHAARNIFLRARAIANDIIDPVFIMGDDDYRPLKIISPSLFLQEGKHVAYYVTDLRKWISTQGAKTSFDISMEKCRDFLMKNNLPTFMFDAHMPQIIRKDLWLEATRVYPEIIEGAASEWSGYFNYVIGNYPGHISLKPYLSLGWPGFLQDWDVDVKHTEFQFENFYNEVYEPKTFYGSDGHFVGFSRDYYPGIEKENEKKIQICMAEEERHFACKRLFCTWQKEYQRLWGMEPVFAVSNTLVVPGEMPILAKDFYHLIFQNPEDSPTEGQLVFNIYDKAGNPKAPIGSARFEAAESSFRVLLQAPSEPGEYLIEWILYSGKGDLRAVTRLLAQAYDTTCGT